MAKYSAKGTKLEFGDKDDGTSTQWTTVAQLRTIDGIGGGDTEEIDVTTHDSPGGYRELLAGFKDGGEVTFEGIYDPNEASHDAATGLLKMYNTGERRDWRIVTTATGNPEIQFIGFLRSIPLSFPIDGPMTFNATIRVAGEVKFPGAED